MAAAARGQSLCTLGLAFHQRLNIGCNQFFGSLLQVRNYAARKGTREKAKKKKVKVEVKKVGFIPHNLRFKKTAIVPLALVRHDDFWKSDCPDDVWLRKYHKAKLFPFAEAAECHKETHHPTCYNSPDAFLYAFVHLDMKGERATKLVEKFQRSVDIPHPFDHGETRNIIAFAKNSELLSLAEKAGASLSGGTELISKIQTGEISVNDFHASVAHPEIMVELSVIRGLMKRKFPNPRNGSLGLDLPAMIKKIKHSIKYTGGPHIQQPLFGTVEVPIGRLNMSAEDLEGNFIAVIKDIEKARPKREGPFITKVFLKSPPSPEILQVDFEGYFETDTKRDTSYDSDQEEEAISNAI